MAPFMVLVMETLIVHRLEPHYDHKWDFLVYLERNEDVMLDGSSLGNSLGYNDGIVLGCN